MEPNLPALVLESAAKVAFVIAMVMGAVTVMTWVERRVSAWIQDRLGPNRVGPEGLFQPIAVGIKFLCKEDIVPPHVYKPLYILAPALSFVPALVGSAVIPFGDSIRLFGRDIPQNESRINRCYQLVRLGMDDLYLGLYIVDVVGFERCAQNR